MKSEQRVQLYRLFIPHLRGALANFLDDLNPTEQARASQYKVVHAYEAFVCTRAVLRRLLAQRLGLTASELVFDYSDTGKPYLRHGACHFNVSHSGDWALIALADTVVGVDIQRQQDNTDYLGLAQRFFAPAEYAALCLLPAAALAPAFFQLWSAKEALIKAQGSSLAALSAIALPVEPSTQQYVIRQHGVDWFAVIIATVPGYSSGVAMRAAPPQIELFDYSVTN